MGLSWIGPGGFGDLLRVVRETHPCYVVIGNQVEAALAVRAASPETLVHIRITGHDWIHNPSYQAGADRMRWLLPLQQASQAQLMSIANEWVPTGDTPEKVLGLIQCCEAYRGAMDVAYQARVKIAVLDSSTGCPYIDRPGVMTAMRRMLAQAEDQGHYLCINHYARNGDPTTDPDGDLWVRIVRDYPRLRVVMREYNSMAEDTPRGEAFTRMLQRGDEAWARYPQFAGAAIFTLSGYPDGEWRRYDFTSELAQYRAHVRRLI